MTATQEQLLPVPPAAGWRAGLEGAEGLRLTVAALTGSALAVVLGLLSGPLWLDEAQSGALARLPLGELAQGLREDGAPPLYYLLMHGWLWLAGDSAVALRLPSALLLIAALVLMHNLAVRLLGVAAGRIALVVLATLPWTARYASEARMYLLVVVLVLLGARSLLALRERPSVPAGAGLCAATGALLLTHYWALFLLVVVGAAQLPGLRRRDPVALRVSAALVGGGLLFVPWLPIFYYQSQHTAAPWAGTPGLEQLLRSAEMWTLGVSLPRIALALALLSLAVVAVRQARYEGSRTVPALAGVVVLPLALAWALAASGDGAYVARYSAIVVPAVALLVAAGVRALPIAGQLPVTAALAAAGLLLGGVSAAQPRTQAGEVAASLARTASPGDVVLACPDQLGPALARVVPPDVRLLAYPTLTAADRVSWVDYEARQEAVSPYQQALRVDALAGSHQLYVAFAPGYQTFGQDCQQLLRALAARRGAPTVEVERRPWTGEEQRLYRFSR